jgi:hypothetical protein
MELCDSTKITEGGLKMPSDDFPNLIHYQKFSKGNLAFVIFGVPKEEINFEEFKRKVSQLKDNDFPLYKELKDSLS